MPNIQTKAPHRTDLLRSSIQWLVIGVALLWSLAALTLAAVRWIDPPKTTVQNNGHNVSEGPQTFTEVLTSAYIKGVRTVDGIKFPTIASAIADLPSTGSFVIHLPTGYRETFTTHYDLGNGTTQAVLLLLDSDVILTCAVNDGTYCFQVHNMGGFIGLRNQALTVARGGGSVISIAAGASVVNVIQTAELPQGSITLEGIDVDNVLGGAVSGAFYNIVNLNNAHTIRDISGAYCPHMGIHISATLGGVNSIGPLNVDNAYIDCVGSAGGRPLVIESDGLGATNGVKINGGFYLDPGSNGAAIEINGHANTTGVLRDIILTGVYTQQQVGTTAVTGVKIVDAAGVIVQGGEFQLTDATTGHTGISIDQTGSGRTHAITVQNFRFSGGSSNKGVFNNITSRTVLTSSGNIFYTYGGTSGTQLPSNYIIDDIKLEVGSGVLPDSGGIKHKRQAGCTTGSTAGNTCTNTVTWSTAFSHANYTPSCTLLGTATLAHLGAISTDVIAAASVKVETVTDTNAAVTGTVNCIALHD